MSGDLGITPEHLEELAIEQDQSATAISDAMEAVNGKAYLLLWDHGLISFPSAFTMISVERFRESACTNMIAVCNDQSEKLRASAKAYGDVDTQAGANLNRQML